jgi:hypothetical protein
MNTQRVGTYIDLYHLYVYICTYIYRLTYVHPSVGVGKWGRHSFHINTLLIIIIYTAQVIG